MPAVPFNAKIFLKKELKNIARTSSLANLVIGNADRRFKSLKNRLINEVDNHPVSEEIKDGPTAENSIAIFSSAHDDGNLFSYIGFRASDDPISKLLNVLDKRIRFNKNFTFKVATNALRIDYFFKVNVPSSNELDSDRSLKLPYEGGKSWPQSIEEGISGIGNYLFDLDRDFKKSSRSGTAIQTKDPVGTRQFIQQPYLTPILDEFVRRLIN